MWPPADTRLLSGRDPCPIQVASGALDCAVLVDPGVEDVDAGLVVFFESLVQLDPIATSDRARARIARKRARVSARLFGSCRT
jgi:hypothetical protein